MLFCLALVAAAAAAATPEAATNALPAAVGGPKHMLAEFYAPWCKSCTKFSPTLRAALSELKKERGDIGIVRVDGDANPELRKRFKVIEAPGLLLFPASQPPDASTAVRYDGALEKAALLT